MNELSTRTLPVITEEIRYLDRQAKRLVLGHAIEIGRRLTEAKALVPYGGWGDYIKDEIGYSQSTANNFMRIFEEYGATQLGLFGPEAESQTLGNLPYTKALKLLAIPAEERETFVETHDVEGMSTRELDKAIKERDEARALAEERQKKLTEAMHSEAQEGIRRTEAESRLQKTEKERDKLQRRVAELENRPVEVAVQRDEAAIQAAVKEAEEKAEQELWTLKKRLADAEEQLQKAQQSADAGKLAEARAEAEELRKQAAKAQAAEAAALFPVWQDSYNRLKLAVERLPEESRQKMLAAMKAQAARWAQ